MYSDVKYQETKISNGCCISIWDRYFNKEILKELKVHHSTVRKIIHNLKTHEKIPNLPKNKGPSKFTARSDQAMPRAKSRTQTQ